MSWNLKSCGRQGRRYLYLWDPALKKKVYVGRGVDAERKDRERTQARISEIERAAKQGALLDKLDALGRPIRELYDAATALMRATLIVAGFSIHDRGEWRSTRRTHERHDAD